MTGFFNLAAILSVLSLGLGLVQLFRSPAIKDVIMSARLVGTTNVSLILFFASLLNMLSSTDLALVLALLAAIAVADLPRRERLSDVRHV